MTTCQKTLKQNKKSTKESIKYETSTIYHSFLKELITAIIFISIFVLTFNFITRQSVANAEYFSSIDALQKLGDVEMGLVEAYHSYLEMQEDELQSYKNFIKNVKEQHEIATEDVEDYLGNPINAFTLIKRMVTDWPRLHEFIKTSQAREELRTLLDKFNEKQLIPDENELKGAVKGLARLQTVYDLNAYDLSRGEINGTDYGTELTWHDCFEIATELYDRKELKLASSWFETTFQKLDEIQESEKDATARKFELETLEYLALTHYELGDPDRALEYIDELLVLSPKHFMKDMRVYILNTPAKTLPPATLPHDWYKNYTELCQGKQVPEKKLHKLKCLLTTRNKPYFILAPLKVEQLSQDPDVNVYHGVLNDIHIEKIIKEAENNMMRSQVKDAKGGIASDIRISQQAWLQYKSPVMKMIYNLVSDITGLDLKNAELMQMANYGIGGQYEPHHDFFGLGNFEEKYWIGDRIVTNMFYLSDVEQGGYTVFPKINIYSRPIKGALIVWYNLHKSVDSDYRTLHAGCPVIVGSKRIGNVWIHSGYQEFRRPCELKNDIEKSFAYRAQWQKERDEDFKAKEKKI